MCTGRCDATFPPWSSGVCCRWRLRESLEWAPAWRNKTAKLESVLFTGQKWLQVVVKVDVVICLTSAHLEFAFYGNVIWQYHEELFRSSLVPCTVESVEL